MFNLVQFRGGRTTLGYTVRYTTLNNLSVWTEFQTNGKKYSFDFGGLQPKSGRKKEILCFSTLVEGAALAVRGSTLKGL